MNVITEIEDLRALAKKRVPRMFYEFADSGSWTESTYRSNEADFRKSFCVSESPGTWRDAP
jgi:L-lactate dehydrogenase (cytochrome)